MNKFDDIRPYCDGEINAAMRRIAGSEHFPALAAYVYPDKDAEAVRRQICAYTTIDEFQLQVMKAVNEQVIKRSISRFTYSGLDKLDRSKRYLFISNHRDIMLDATLLQYALYLEGHRTSEITFGSNLMNSQLVVDIGRSNKMFKVMRGGGMRDFYANLLHLSEYIRYAVTCKGESVWIAQRNGRSKDGIDKTEFAILKMFAASSRKPFAENLNELNIVPIAISYEYEPCGFYKAQYVAKVRQCGHYTKHADEDLTSILHGINQWKGGVNCTFCPPITMSELEECMRHGGNERFKALAQIVDERIYDGYKLFPTNYIARSILSSSAEYAHMYSPAQQAEFAAYLQHVLQAADAAAPELYPILLGIYAEPVRTACSINK
jgi:1-acyl-sn-glycerol-3-phosphate acyltransferase